MAIKLNRMPDKKRFLDALNYRPNPEVAFVETELDFVIFEKILGRKLNVKRSYDLPPDDYIELLQNIGMDAAYLAVPWRLGRIDHLDAQGRKCYGGGKIKTPDDLKLIKDPGDDDLKRRLDEMCNALTNTQIGNFYCHINTPSVVCAAMGYEDYFLNMIAEPEFVQEVFKRVDEVLVRHLELILKYPIDALLICAGMAGTNGPLISPELQEQFEWPYLTRSVKMVKARNIPVIFHCDGDNRGFMERFIDIGISGIQAVDPCAGRQNIFELKKKYNKRLSFHGGVNSQNLVNATPEEIVTETTHLLDEMSIDGGFICSSTHDLNPRMPIENILAMINTIHQYRK